MDKKKIIIVTGTGGILGTGHLQRMLNLAVRINRSNTLSASILLRQNEFPLPEKWNNILVESIPQDISLIIRDMRDSSIDEIVLLKQIAPVIVIDDSGPGRMYAKHVINLLPLPSEDCKNIKPDTSLFLYGYNFTEGINLLTEKNTPGSNIDIAVYAGYNPSDELVSSIRNSIPLETNSILLKGGKATPLTGKFSQLEVSYTEILVRTKIIITHFGLTMFEADACGCKIASLNPTEYHTKLTETVKKNFNIIYSSDYNSFAPDVLQTIIRHELAEATSKNYHLSEIIKKINSGTENFIDFISGTITTSI